MTTKRVLQFYNVNSKTVVSVDASKSSCGAEILQNNLPCAYASMAFSETQCRYAQIETELLANVVGFDKFHQFIFGKKIIVETDNLINVFKS